ncbi:tetratricopeptide repeat protein [Desulforamulus aquiferis]|nr:tetratricopeptide repeat protein [Desulforamulus aquiferis]
MWMPGKLNGKKVNLWQVVACLLEAAGASKPALRSVEKALQVQPEQADLHLQASRLYLKLGQVDQAALHCKKAALGLGPGSFIYWLDRAANGGIKSSRMDDSEMVFSFAQEKEIIPHAPTNDKTAQFNNSGLCLLENGRYQEALVCFQEALALGGKDPGILHNLGLSLSKLGRHTEALDYYKEVQSLGISSAELLNNKGYSLFYLEHYEEALACYEVARQYLPRDLGLLSNLASCYNYLGRVEEAIGCYRSAIKAFPKDATLHNNLGICLENLGHTEEALESFGKAVELSPGNNTILLNYGHCMLNCGRLDEVYDIVEAILTVEPNNYPAWGLRGEVLAIQGKMGEAARCYGRALGLAG